MSWGVNQREKANPIAPDTVLQAVLDSFQAQHRGALHKLHPDTRSTIREHVPKVFNREQRRSIQHSPLHFPELQHALDRLKKGVVPGVDGLPAEAYLRLTLPVKCRLAARLWDIVTGTMPIPPEWANLVHPLHKKGDWAQPGNWRPIVCATTEVKLVWMLILGRIAPAVFAHLPGSMWGAVAGRSPHGGHLCPGHRAGHEPLQDERRLPRCPMRVSQRTAPAPHRGVICHGHPIPTPHAHAEDTPLKIPRQAHLQRNYTALRQATAAGEGHAAASGAADRTTDECRAPGGGTRVEVATNTASEPIGPPPGTTPPWGRRHLDYARLGGDTSRPSDQAEKAAARDLALCIPRLTAGEQLALADITFGHQTGHTPPATMDHPGQWHYVATRIMAHMGAYNPDEVNGLHWQWHQRAALRIRAIMQ